MGLANLIRAELYLQLYWIRNNRVMAVLQVVWPYASILVLYTLGTAYGSLENLSRVLGVEDPLVYIVAASAVMFAASSIVDNISNVGLWQRWLGTLTYVYSGVPSYPKYLIASGVASSLFQAGFTFLALAPAALAIGGLDSGLRLLLVFAVMLFGSLPLVGLGVAAALLSVMFREETNVFSFLNPLLVFLGGVFYPVEVLPRILQHMSTLVPVKYVVDAARIASGFQTPEGSGLLLVLYALALLSILYNLLALAGIPGLERRARRRGVF